MAKLNKNETSNEVTVQEENPQNLQVATADLNSGNLPDLNKAHEFPVDLMSEYWTPEKTGEVKRLFFDKVQPRYVKDQSTDEVIELECAFFLEQTEDGVKTICNGSKRLVGAIQAYDIQRGTPLLVTYKGKKRNRTNQFHSDDWSVKLLMINA